MPHSKPPQCEIVSSLFALSVIAERTGQWRKGSFTKVLEDDMCQRCLIKPKRSLCYVRAYVDRQLAECIQNGVRDET